MKIAYITTLVTLLFLSACTTTKWSVAEMYGIDETAEPEIIDRRRSLILDRKPTIQDPFFRLSAIDIADKAIPQRVKMKRTVQKYRPRISFMIFAVAGSAITFYAANSGNIINSPSSTQKLGLNLSGGILSLLAFTNMKPVGEPIRTGEEKFMRESGSVIRPDTLETETHGDEEITISISYNDTLLVEERTLSINGSSVEVDLSSFFSSLSVTGTEPDSMEIEAGFLDSDFFFKIPLKDFLAPFVVIKKSTANLRSTPEVNDINIFTELAEGSALPFIEKKENWYKVRFGGTDTYVPQESASIEWRVASEGISADVITLGEVPFGEIDVENAIPVIKSNNPDDRAFVLSNHRDNQLSDRQFHDRDIRLFESYMMSGFMMNPAQITEFEIRRKDTLQSELASLREDSLNTVWAYITGYAKIGENDNSDNKFIKLIHRDNEGRETEINLNEHMEQLASIQQERLIILADIEFINSGNTAAQARSDVDVLAKAAQDILNIQPDAVLIFSSRPSQSSRVYTGRGEDNKYHSVFTYYWAEALQQRKVKVSELISHIQNNVDYTSRRLFDRPQEIQVFGNLSIDLSR